MPVPYTFGSATSAIPLSQLDANFATTITLGNTAIQLGNTVTTLNNMTLANVTISSGSVTITSATVTSANVTSTLTLSGLTASTALALDASKNVVSVTNTGTGNNVLATSPTLVTPVLGTPTSGTLTNCTGYPTSALSGNINLATQVTGTLGTTNGGTGLTSFTSGGAVYATSTSALTTGTLPTTAGGTGLTSFTANGVVYASSTSALTTGSALSFNGTVLQNDQSSASSGLLFNLQNTSTGSYMQFAMPGVANVRFGAPNADAFVWQTFGSGTYPEQMRLTSTGLGIGTSSPAYKLDVAGSVIRLINSGATADLFLTDSGTTNGYVRLRGESNALKFITGNGISATIDSSGNLGLGVTPSAWETANSVRALQFNGGQISSYSTSYLWVGQNFYRDSTSTEKYVNNGFASKYQQNSGIHSWYTAPSGTAGNAISFTQAMTLDASGNLGVGTTSPSTFGALCTRRGISVAGVTGSVSASFSDGANDTLYISQDSNLSRLTFSALTFNTGTTERARITSGGDLLVGVTSKSQDTSEGNFVIGFDGAVDNAILTHDTSAATTTNALVFGKNNTVVGTITNTSTSTAFNTSSDYRLKDNPQPLTGSGAFIDALKPKTWDWKAGGKGVGFIAHEVQEVSPGSVVGTKDAVDEEGKPIMQAMEYGSAEFIANIIAELQSLRARVAQLEAK